MEIFIYILAYLIVGFVFAFIGSKNIAKPFDEADKVFIGILWFVWPICLPFVLLFAMLYYVGELISKLNK